MFIQVYLGDLIIKKKGKFFAKGSIFLLFCIISIHQSLLKLMIKLSEIEASPEIKKSLLC